jgi:hypothetical protein
LIVEIGSNGGSIHVVFVEVHVLAVSTNYEEHNLHMGYSTHREEDCEHVIRPMAIDISRDCMQKMVHFIYL